MKKILGAVFLILLLIVGAYLYALQKNNSEVSMPDKVVLQQHFDQSLIWLKNNKNTILNNHNSMLWWMLFEASKISNSDALNELIATYRQQNSRFKYGIWGPLLWPQQRSKIDEMVLYGLPDYNQHFIYSLHCATKLEESFPVIIAQNKADFCFQSSHIYRPACVTHQLMGINFQQVQHCRNKQALAPVIKSLQADIVNQLTWDVRVVDVYLQRVMMLLVTAAEDQVKPIWVHQIIQHQLKDGGWGDFDPIISLGSQSIGFSSRILSVSSTQSTFHATAQGIYLLSLLLQAER